MISSDWIEEGSELALPGLLREGQCFDLAFIDGLHTADQTLLDFYFLDRMLRVGGVIVIDDVNSPAVNKAAHYFSKYPNYRLIGVCGSRGIRRRGINGLKTDCLNRPMACQEGTWGGSHARVPRRLAGPSGNTPDLGFSVRWRRSEKAEASSFATRIGIGEL